MAEELTYGFKMPLFPLFPILAIICQTILAFWLIHMSEIACYVVPAWIGGGILIYYFYSKTRAITTPNEILTLAEEKEITAKKPGYRIMVPVSNPEHVISKERIIYELGKSKENTSIDFIHMVQIPEQVPPPKKPEKFEKYMVKGKEAIAEAILAFDFSFMVNSTIRFCRNIVRGIVNTVREKKSDLLILGWHGHKGFKGFRMGWMLEKITHRVPCDVIILKGKVPKCKNILVALAEGPHSRLAYETAKTIAKGDNARLTAVHVDNADEFNFKKFFLKNVELDHFNATVQKNTIHGGKVVPSIVYEARNYDLLVIGCSNRAITSIAESVARKIGDKPVIIVKASHGIGSWIKKWV